MAIFNGGTGPDTYTGTADADQANGNAGNDVLNGAGGDDTLNGGDNDDRLIGGAGADTLIGGNGFLNILFSDAEDTRYAGPLSAGFSYDFGTEHDVLTGGSGDDSLFVGIGDSADGGAGFALRGDKLFISFRGATAGVNADFRLLANGATAVIEGGTYSSIEDVVFIEGTQWDDFLAAFSIFTGINSAVGTFIYGYGGNDTIIASKSSGTGSATAHGPPALYGGDGDDLIDDRPSFYGSSAWGEAGDDHIIGSPTGAGGYHGGDGNDVLEGNGWIDNLYGDAGNDILDGGSHRDNIFGGSENDTIYGAGDGDTIDGGDGDDVIYGDFSLISTANELTFGNDDILRGGAGVDTLNGEQGNDTLDGGTGADTMRGSTGNDIYYVDDAGDVVEENAGEGTDELRTAFAGYSLVGTNLENLTATSDVAHDFRGNGASNVVTGGAGDDLLRLDDGGNDSALGGVGNDSLYFGAAFTGSDVANGGTGRDVVILQGNYTLTLSATNLVGVESLSLQSGSRTTWGDTANNFYDYNITVNNANAAGPDQVIVNGQSLRAGEDFTFNGAAESGDGRYLVYGGHGIDTFTGGAGADTFFFEGDRFGAGDSVNGGAGRDALIISAGNGVTHIEFGATSLTSIESISLNARFATDPTARPSYELVLNNGNVAAGANLIVNGNSLADPVQSLSVDGSAVHDGSLTLIGGFGSDTLIGGDGGDVLQGGQGVDVLTGGVGADIFRYAGPSDSTSALPDEILDFASGADRIDLVRIDADTFAAGDQAFHWIGSNAFSGNGAASAGELRAFASGGDWFVEGDTNGDGAADLVIQLTAPAAPIVQGDFLL